MVSASVYREVNPGGGGEGERDGAAGSPVSGSIGTADGMSLSSSFDGALLKLFIVRRGNLVAALISLTPPVFDDVEECPFSFNFALSDFLGLPLFFRADKGVLVLLRRSFATLVSIRASLGSDNGGDLGNTGFVSLDSASGSDFEGS